MSASRSVGPNVPIFVVARCVVQIGRVSCARCLVISQYSMAVLMLRFVFEVKRVGGSGGKGPQTSPGVFQRWPEFHRSTWLAMQRASRVAGGGWKNAGHGWRCSHGLVWF